MDLDKLAAGIGQDKPTQDPMDAIKAATGTYKDVVEGLPDERRLPMLPKAPDPNPFALGPLTSGQR